MTGRIYRLAEYLRKAEQHLRLQEQRRNPDVRILLHVRSVRPRFRDAPRRALDAWVNPHRLKRARIALSLLAA